MDYEIVMKDGLEGPSLDERLTELLSKGLIEEYGRFRTGHYYFRAAEPLAQEYFEGAEGIEQILEAPAFRAIFPEYRTQIQ